MTPEPFTIAIPQAGLDDLRARLERFRAAWEPFFNASTDGRGTMISRLR